MKPLFKTVILFILFTSYMVMAQNISVDKEIKKIDSLITYKQLDAAEKKADSFYKLLNEKYHSDNYLEQRVFVHFLQGLVKDKQYQHNNALPIFLEVLKEAEKDNLYKIACRAKILIALTYEHSGNTELAYTYLTEARKMSKAYHFYDLYSTLYIRFAQMHRYFGFEKKSELSDEAKRMEKLGLHARIDSAFYYAQQAIAYGKKYNNENDMNDGYVVMGHLSSLVEKASESSSFYLKSVPYWKKTNNYETLANMYNNVAANYIKAKNYKEALKYSDLAMPYYKNMFVYHKYHVSKRRALIYKELGVMDSAYHYLQLAYDDKEKSHNEAELSTAKDLEEKYQNDKKEETIKNKNKIVLLIGSLLGVIVIASILLFLQNRKINSRNKIINRQLVELSKTLDQKQVLLSELQHRVKNNLQHVISILEIQKESVDFNNIDELIRGNQNRIHSMALLHKKLNVQDNANEVDLKRYVTELSDLVKESYDNHKKKINLNIKCEIEKISIEKALPLGLIIVELVSNSMKYAFRKRNIGIINIAITKNETGKLMYYSDNGEGFDFDKVNDKGLGLEIIKGLIDQLNGVTESKAENGFELNIYFK